MEKGSFAATRCQILTKQTANQVMTGDKYIGVMLDNKLSFNQHIDEIVNKTSKLSNLCRRNLHMTCAININQRTSLQDHSPPTYRLRIHRLEYSFISI